MSSAEDMLGWSGGELRSAAGSLGCGDMVERIAPTLPVWKGASHRQAVGTGSASFVYVLRSIPQRRRRTEPGGGRCLGNQPRMSDSAIPAPRLRCVVSSRALVEFAASILSLLREEQQEHRITNKKR